MIKEKEGEREESGETKREAKKEKDRDRDDQTTTKRYTEKEKREVRK